MCSYCIIILPSVLPEYIEVDLALLDVGGTLHLSDLVLPEGVELIELLHGPEHDLPVVSMMSSKASKEDAADDASKTAG